MRKVKVIKKSEKESYLTKVNKPFESVKKASVNQTMSNWVKDAQTSIKQAKQAYHNSFYGVKS